MQMKLWFTLKAQNFWFTVYNNSYTIYKCQIMKPNKKTSNTFQHLQVFQGNYSYYAVWFTYVLINTLQSTFKTSKKKVLQGLQFWQELLYL